MKEGRSAAGRRFRGEDVLFLISGLAVLALFLSLSIPSYVLIAAGFALLIRLTVRREERPTTASLTTMRITGGILTLQLLIAGYNNFYATWVHSSKLSALAASLGTTVSTLLLIGGIALCAVAAWGMNALACLIVRGTLRIMKKYLPEPRKAVILSNLRANAFLPASAVAFFMLNATANPGYANGMQISFLASLLLASQVPPLTKTVRGKGKGLCLFSLATAAGICLGELSFYRSYWAEAENFAVLQEVLPVSAGFLNGLSAVLAAAALPCVFLGVLFFWDRLISILRGMRIFDGIRGAEAALYGLLLILSLGVMAFSFARSDAFYGTDYLFDIIYSSDSPDLMKQNAFLALTQSENDLRQPLFAVFAAPFIGLPYLLGSLTGSAAVRAILINAVMVGMLFAAQLLLARALELDRRGRICFLVFLFCSYTQMLFTLMIEQYIIAYFWLTLCICRICRKEPAERLAFFGAGGTILTNLALLPFLSGHSPWKHPKEWFLDAFRRGLEFLALTLAFCRFDIYYSLGYNIRFLSQFTGEDLAFPDRLNQYTAFVRNCFLAPLTAILPNADKALSWQLGPISSIHWTGVILFGLAVISFLWNRKKRSSQLAGYWILLSITMLLLFGWGTQENGLILYSLYFGWAYMVLLFQLAEKAEEKLKTCFLLPAATAAACAGMLAVNVPGMVEMIRFAISHYPV